MPTSPTTRLVSMLSVSLLAAGAGAQATAVGGALPARALAVGDLNGDRRSDLVVGTDGEGVRVFLNDPAQGLQPLADATPSFDVARGVALLDADGDGRLDLAIAGHRAGNRLWLGRGDGTFAEAGYGAMPEDDRVAVAVAAGDVDGDRDLDLVFANVFGACSVYRNDGSGRFTTAANDFPARRAGTCAVVLFDVDADGDLDVLAAAQPDAAGNGGRNALFVNDGKGVFRDASEELMPWTTGHSCALAVADLDGDGRPDFAVADCGPRGGGGGRNTVHVLRSKFGLGDPRRLPAGDDVSQGVAAGDVDGDGDVDLVFANRGRDRLFRNDGEGVFVEDPTALPADADDGRAVLIADFDGDGAADLVVANHGAPLRFLRNDGKGGFGGDPAAVSAAPVPAEDAAPPVPRPSPPQPPTATEPTPEQQAVEALTKAEDLAARGHYGAAHAAYRDIARRYEGTPAAGVAAARSGRTGFLGWSYLEQNGPSGNRVDVAIMGDSFQLDDQNRFDDMAKVVPDLFRRNKTLGEYQAYHNFLRVNLASKDDDIDAYGREYETALDAAIMGNNAPWVTVSHGRVHAMLEQLPEHDGLALVLVKPIGVHGTGGSGVGVVAGRQDSVIIHEWGHAFGNLGDEYTTFTFPRGSVATSPNVSNTEDPLSVPWSHWLVAKTPGVGVYRGGNGQLNGAWRPVASSCIMESGSRFCPVCREAMVLRIHQFVDPIDGCEPPAHRTKGDSPELDVPRDGVYRFAVDIMQPKSHGLDVRWWVLPAAEVPAPVAEGPIRDRTRRGPLAPITARPEREVRNSRARRQEFEWKPERGLTGRYRVLCRVRDSTRVAGQSLTWVLKDEFGVLESERGWWVQL